MSQSKPIPFEAALQQLEAVVAQLERGDVPLEQALSDFERGMQLAKQCQDRLQAVERRVEIIVNTLGEAPRSQPLVTPAATETEA